MTSDCTKSPGWIAARKRGMETQKRLRADAREEYAKNPNLCGNCLKALSFQKKRHKFCSQKCNAIKSNLGYNRIAGIPARGPNQGTPCKFCGNQVLKKDRNALFCNKACMTSFHDLEREKEWETVTMFEEKEMTPYGRQYYLKKFNFKCCECGWDKINPFSGRSTLTIEHVDGISVHNYPSNIKVLCPSCHSLTSTYGSLNKGKSTRNYRVRYYKRAIEKAKRELPSNP
jgi:hypothetical protein